MAPLAALGGPLLMRAALATASVVGAISLTAATAPSQVFVSVFFHSVAYKTLLRPICR
jgi:hypothetical protein